MRQNVLLRSVKGSGEPSTARKQDRKDDRKARLKVAVSSAAENRQEFAAQDDTKHDTKHDAQDLAKDHFAVRNGVRCAGVHLIVDLHDAKRLNDIDHIEATLRHCVEASRATLLHIHLHHFQPSGVSGVAVLAESHISIHTWPEAGYAALDIFMCGSAEPDNCIPVLRDAFSAKRVEVNEILRGQDVP
jgi:S-adenosylmethionine decarboxylase